MILNTRNASPSLSCVAYDSGDANERANRNQPNVGIFFTAWGVAGIIGPRIGGVFYDRYDNYQAAFYTAAALAFVALLTGFRRVSNTLSPKPSIPNRFRAVA